MNNLALNSKDNQQAWAEYLAGLEAPLPFLDLDKHDLFENEMPDDTDHRKFLQETTNLSRTCHVITENFARYSGAQIKLLNSDDSMVHGDVEILNQTLSSLGWDRSRLSKGAYHDLLRIVDPNYGHILNHRVNSEKGSLIVMQMLNLPDSLHEYRMLFPGKKGEAVNNPIDWPTAKKKLQRNFNLYGFTEGEFTLWALLHELFHATTPNFNFSYHEQEVIADFGACTTMLRLGYKHIFEKVILMRQEILDFNLLEAATKTNSPDKRERAPHTTLSYALSYPLRGLYMHIRENINPAEFAKWDLKAIHELTHEMAKRLSFTEDFLESLFFSYENNHGKITAELHDKWEKRGDLWAKFHENKQDCTQRQRLQEITNQAKSSMNQKNLIRAFDALQKQHEGELLSPDYAMDYFRARANLYRQYQQYRNNRLF